MYGIGMPIVITLGRGVSKDDEAKIQKRLTVVSTPEQTGSWYWMSNKEDPLPAEDVLAAGHEAAHRRTDRWRSVR